MERSEYHKSSLRETKYLILLDLNLVSAEGIERNISLQPAKSEVGAPTDLELRKDEGAICPGRNFFKTYHIDSRFCLESLSLYFFIDCNGEQMVEYNIPT